MPRFYIPQPMAIGDVADLPAATSHHVQVLRLVPGAIVTLFNGEGGEFTATLSEHQPSRKLVRVELKAFSPREAELPYAVTLAQALPEASKMDWIIEKAVELGATAIQPLSTQRCVVRLSPERAEKKLLHWRAITIAAAEQSNRNRLTHISGPEDFAAYTGQQDLHRRIVLSPHAQTSFSHWARHQPPQAVTLMIGPEGGFSELEEKQAEQHGALLMGMGPRVLRTETAGLAALAALNAIWGEM